MLFFSLCVKISLTLHLTFQFKFVMFKLFCLNFSQIAQQTLRTHRKNHSKTIALSYLNTTYNHNFFPVQKTSIISFYLTNTRTHSKTIRFYFTNIWTHLKIKENVCPFRKRNKKQKRREKHFFCTLTFFCSFFGFSQISLFSPPPWHSIFLFHHANSSSDPLRLAVLLPVPSKIQASF